ncbi:hypothetical protein PAAG_12160 [Paracoccidioides lutzii Pb01]|uniref:Uncharacterized protein n=1 Tax=Paracoccidioides lutzii (strain ATCC MYA-826 / Pb01) TaxID=502779 RepID=A0A0A2V444_PARBA|nr:hypothetical protein PAAG_12160 [Paracoccidioides lutzii Pb01]KGQ01122.1 hypothetical protein PAAG_12160 [Paracoccidioides lutzii Pb01]
MPHLSDGTTSTPTAMEPHVLYSSRLTPNYGPNDSAGWKPANSGTEPMKIRAAAIADWGVTKHMDLLGMYKQNISWNSEPAKLASSELSSSHPGFAPSRIAGDCGLDADRITGIVVVGQSRTVIL